MLTRLKQKSNRWLFDPLVPVETDTHNRLALLAVILLFLTIFGGIASIAYFVVSYRYGVAQEGVLFNAAAVVFMGLCYALARMGHYVVAALGTISIAFAGIIAIAIAAPENYLVLSYLVVPVVLGGVLFSTTMMVMLGGLSVVIMLALPLIFDVDLFSIIDGPLPLVLSVTAIFSLSLTILQRRNLDLKLSTIARSVDSLILVHRAGRILYINPAGMKILGARSPHDLIGKQFDEFIQRRGHPGEGSTVELLHFDQEPTLRTREKLVRLDGRLIQVEILTDRITFNGQPATQIIARTEGDRLKDAMETAYSHFADNAEEAVMIYDRQGRLLYTNPAGLALSGYRWDELQGIHFERLLLEPVPAMHEPRMNLYTPGNVLDMRTRTGTIQPVEVVAHSQHDDYALVVLRENTTREAQTLRIESHFARLFNTTAFGAAITRLTDDTLLNVNDSFLAMLEYERDEIIGKRIGDLNLYESIEERELMVSRLNKNGSAPPTEVRFRTRSGELRDMLISMETIEVAETPCLVAVLQDVSEYREIERHLILSEERYRLVSELMADYAYSWRVHHNADVMLQLEWVTDAFETITGYTLDEAQQMRGWGLVYPEDVELRKRKVRSLLTGATEISEFRIVTKAGAVRWVRDYAYPVWNDDRTTVTGIYGAVRDITEQIERENAIRVQALQQAIVAELGQRALENPTRPDVLLNDVVTLVAQVLNERFVAVLMLDEDGQQLTIRAGVGWSKAKLATCIPIDSSIQEHHTLQIGEAMIVGDYAEDDRFTPSPLIEGTGIKSGMTVLVQGHMPVFGVLGVYSRTRDRFSQDDRNFLQSVANVVASYLDQREIIEAEAKQRALAEALGDTAAVLNSTLNIETVMDRVLDHVARVVPHDGASIMLVEHGYVHILKYRTPDGDDPQLADVRFPIADAPNVIHMVDSGAPVVITDTLKDAGWRYFTEKTRWIRAYVGAPIYFQGELLGIINLDSRTPGAFAEADARRLQAFANQAAIAIHNARHATELEQRVAERTAQLDLEHRRIQAILESTGEGIFYTEGLTIRYANRAFCEMTGYKPGELVGQSTAVLIAEGLDEEHHRIWADTQKALRRGIVIRSERELQRRDGSTFQAALTISLGGSPDDTLGSLTTVTVVRDISQEKRLATQKSRFIANASHELRSPMSSLKLHLYMLKRQPERADYHMTLLERITERMNILVEDLLDISRIEQGVIQLRRRSAILQDLVHNVLEIMRANATDKQITLTHDFITDPLHVFVDPERIDQVVTNIVSNAINYTPQGGSIQVTVGRFHDEMTQREMGCITVQDTGIGISTEDQPHIFEAFYRADTNSEGTGLGLNISREIMLLHDGDITLESAPHEGSTFTLILPLFNS